MEKKSTQQIFVEWITALNTPENAWQTMIYEQMADVTGISKGYINRVLIAVVSQTLQLDYGTAKQMRKDARAGEKGWKSPINWCRKSTDCYGKRIE